MFVTFKFVYLENFRFSLQFTRYSYFMKHIFYIKPNIDVVVLSQKPIHWNVFMLTKSITTYSEK